MTDWQEKRKYKRAFIKLMVEYRGKNLWQMVEAKDISAGGIFILTNKVEPPQTKVEVIFELGKDARKKTIRAEGVVAWNRSVAITDEKGETQPAGMGIMFTKIYPFISQEVINDLINKMEDSPHKDKVK
jgi:c-di-GMP-binding flagellar brake protein YcgR